MRRVRPPLSLMIFDFNYAIPSIRINKTYGDEISKDLGNTSVLILIL